MTVKTLELPERFGFGAMAQTAPGDLTAMRAYYCVPWLRRCVDLRANAIATLPLRLADKAGDEVEPWPELRSMLLLSEQALCLHGAAYWLLQRRGRVILGVRWLAPQTISPQYSDTAITGYRRLLAGREYLLRPEDVVALFERGVAVELGPAIPLAQTALEAARSVFAAQQYTAAFFERGAVPAVILSVEGEPEREELDRLEMWWRRLLRGVRHAWETVAVKATVKPQVVGITPGKDLAMPDLMEVARQQIATALGVPQTLLEDAANYATAAEHRLSFYEETIVPRARFLEDQLNRQLFSRLDWTLAFVPERLEVFQEREAQKAQSLVALVQAGIMDADEARDQMALPPRQRQQPEQPAAVEREAVAAELRRWARKCQRQPDANFESDIIPRPLKALIEYAINTSGPGIWSCLKQPGRARNDAERRLQAAVQDVLRRYAADMGGAVAEGGDTEAVLLEMQSALQAAVMPEVTRIAYEAILRHGIEMGISFDPATINTAALQWARTYTYDLIKGLTNTTRETVRQAISHLVETPGTTIGDVREMLAPAFGDIRAQMIAVTETTRAYSQATTMYQGLLSAEGLQAVRVWRTSHDEGVCPLCEPLEGMAETEWPAEAQGGPPRHVNCRCWLVLEYDERKQ